MKKNLTQSELADWVEKKREYLSKIENKRILISSELIINNEIKVLRQLPPVPIMYKREVEARISDSIKKKPENY